jgi:hypothetical protein
MSDSEIRRRHKEGATVQILADLNAVPSSNIKAILDDKPIPATPKKKYEHRSAEYKKLYDEGKGDSEIGELMGTRASNVWSWRKTNNLPSNVAPKRKKEKKVDPVEIIIPAIPEPRPIVELPTPPIGLRPSYIWKSARRNEIMQAAQRYADAKRDIPYEWMQEYWSLFTEEGG